MGQFLIDVAAILVAAGILAAVAVGGVALGALWLRRWWRRKRVELAIKLNERAIGVAASGVRWLWTRPKPDRRWRTLQRARRDLLRASLGAEHAVREARTANASLGDLMGLTRRVRQAAVDVDRSLRVAQRADGADGVDELLQHARELTRAAHGIRRAAAASLAELHRHVTFDLVSHVHLEEQAMDREAVR